MPQREVLYVLSEKECFEINLPIILIKRAYKDSDDVLILSVRVISQDSEEFFMQ